MKKLLTALFCSVIGGSAIAQWTPAAPSSRGQAEASPMQQYFKLDLNLIRDQLKNAQETGPSAKPVYISIPSINGKIEKFAVYSFPVVVKEISDQYQLGSYIGTSTNDPTKIIRFSVAPNDFQSMTISNGNYEFIEPENADKTLYKVHPKSKKTDGKSFLCSTEEGSAAVQQIEKMLKNGSSFSHQPTDFAKMSDKKYRTMRLVMSVTGEYTTFHGGTVAGALAAINATMTRVNGVFEKDFALHLNLQNFPSVIFTNASTDPYSDAATGAGGAWNLELQNTLSSIVGDTNYDIGHLFGASGGGGNAGCIGCVCVNPTTSVPKGKGSGYTSPANAIPQGDTFDIDYVAHELGHQLGANHTFSQSIEGAGVNVEPGSGSTIMGYAGITGPNTDVQANSDAYFHKVSITQVQNNLIAKTCDVEITTTNNPPVIAALPSYSIPKGTAFVLTASATDPESDPMTYTWEQVDSGTTSAQTINKNNLGLTTYGASFRSLTPTTSPTRYFPKLSSVLNGVLNNSTNQWESVSYVARNSKFAVTVRDNNPNPLQQQTQFAEQIIVVGNDGPFKVNTLYANSGAPTAIEWDVANTTAAPYNVTNVSIDYTTNNGTTWTVLSSSTPNDGTENFTFPSSLNGQNIKLRISSLNNVFYAIGQVSVATFAACNGSAPTGVVTSGITANSATVTWAPISNATYIIRYRPVGSATWNTVTSNNPTITLTGLNDGVSYEVQIASVCSGTTGAYSASVSFTTTQIPYCTAASTSGQFNYISNVTLGTVNNTTTGTTYSNFTANPTLQISLVPNSTNNAISVSLTTTVAGAANNGMAAWIDFNRNGIFESSERVLNMIGTALPVGSTTINGTFAVPSTAVLNAPLRMRIVMVLLNGTGATIPDSFACGSFPNGEVEDYNVTVVSNLSTSETSALNNGIQMYPNPATEVLNITKVSDKANYKIYSAAGQLVGRGNVTDGKINITNLIKGAYVITIDEKGQDVFKSKFIKK